MVPVVKRGRRARRRVGARVRGWRGPFLRTRRGKKGQYVGGKREEGVVQERGCYQGRGAGRGRERLGASRFPLRVGGERIRGSCATGTGGENERVGLVVENRGMLTMVRNSW